jgi:hypothetical protein
MALIREMSLQTEKMRECEDTDRQVNDRSNADGGNDRADVVERGDSYQPIRGELHLLYWRCITHCWRSFSLDFKCRAFGMKGNNAGDYDCHEKQMAEMLCWEVDGLPNMA